MSPRLLPSLFVGIAVLGLSGLLFLGYLGWRGMTQGLSGLHQRAEQAAEVLEDVLQGRPRITINQKIIWQATMPVAEFAVVAKEGQMNVQWENTRFGSRKNVILNGSYQAKAGFDLREDFSLQIDPVTNAVLATLPPAKILTVEWHDDLQMKSSSGLINWVNDADRSAAITYFQQQTRALVEKSGLKQEAEEQVLGRLKELAAKRGGGMEFRVKKVGQ